MVQQNATAVVDAGPELPASGLVVRVCGTWSRLTEEVVEAIRAAVPDDPFAELPVVVRGAASRRALSQAVARATGTGEVGGVCAGLDLCSLTSLRRLVEERLLGRPASADPWRRRALALTVLQVLQASGDEPWFAPLAHHLHPATQHPGTQHTGTGIERPGRWLATSERIAHLLTRYARHCPSMLVAWSEGSDVGWDGSPLPATAAWQPQVWRRCRELLADAPDPVERQRRLLAALRDHTTDARALGLPSHLLVADPGPLSVAEHEFLAAVAARCPVTVFTLAPAAEATPWGARLGRSQRAALDAFQAVGRVEPSDTGPARSDDTVLHALQRRLAGLEVVGSRAEGDRSVQVHASHGPDRQVEVLRDVLARLFEQDRSLDPRDVVVACPDLDLFAPLVRASFGAGAPSDDPAWSASARHPATQLRVQVAASSLGEPNGALALLQRLLALPASRATGQDLLDLCSSPVVAHRFGLEGADLDLLARLLAAAEVRWGVDAGHRERFGVGGIRQSTWLAAVDRLLVGLAMGEQPPGWLDTVAPVPMIGSKHAGVIGALAEVVSRVRRLVALWSRDATMSEWVARLREALDQLAAASGPEAVVVAHARTQLALLGDLSARSEARVSLGDVRGQFDRLLATGTGRANHGNGSLLVTRLSELDDVSHRVVVVLGLDDGVLPPPQRHDGDDLLPPAATPETDVRSVALRQFHEAVRAASDTLVVIHQGFDPRTNEAIPQSPVLGDLVDACAPLGGVTAEAHTLLAESLANFVGDETTPPFSFDPVAVRGAIALDRRVSTHVDDAEPTRPSPADTPADTTSWAPSATPVELRDLVTFLRNPAAAHLTSVLGVSLGHWGVELDPELPIEADGLVRWRLGEQFLAAELAGTDLDEVERAARLGGDLPPGPLADKAVNKVRSQALRIGEAVLARTTRPGSRDRRAAVDRLLHVDLRDLDAGLVVGRTRTVDDTILSWRFGRVRWQELLDAWVHLLALQASVPSPAWRALCVGTDGISRLRPPEPDAARVWLADLVRLRGRGLQRVVPLPLEVVAELTPLDAAQGAFGRQKDEQQEAAKAWRKLRDRPEWRMTLDLDWNELSRLAPLPDDPGRPGPSRLEQLRHWLVDPVLDHLDREPLP